MESQCAEEQRRQGSSVCRGTEPLGSLARWIARTAVVLAVLVCGSLALTDSAVAGGGGPNSLKTVPVPLPGDLGNFIRDFQAATRLGKALFWDVQVGGDGQVACATCHYNAGVDARTNNGTVHAGPNGVIDISLPLTRDDFPLHNDDRIGSQGVRPRTFNGLVFGSAGDNCTGPTSGPRQVTGRNTPPMIDAIFHIHNFWDGRAKREFNGVTPAGQVDPRPMIWVNDPDKGLVQESVIIQPASAASQEVGPPNNGVEMSCDLRSFPQLGRKMINNGLTPLGAQKVAADDSVLGPLSNYPANGLNTTYKALIDAAFQPEFTSDATLPDGSGFTQKEANFSLFWGLSIMMYDSTLVANDTKFDKAREGLTTLTSQEQQGLNLFNDKARCKSCHGGPEFTSASIMNGSNGDAFVNTGVRPVADDGGVQPDIQGEFKSSHLRNISLTGPYFHNGGYLTLKQVVNFYNRGGDFPGPFTDSNIRPLGLTSSEEDAIVAFMLTLTDNRVECEKKPFDHPSIVIPEGPSITQVGQGGRSSSSCLKPFLLDGSSSFHFKMAP